MKKIIRLTEEDIRNIVKEAMTVTQYTLFGEPEVKRIRKTRKDKMTPEQKAAAKAERDAKKKAQKEKEAEEAWRKRGVVQTKLFDDDNNVNESKTMNESFAHWKSPKLAEIVKQHGISKYNNMSTNYFLTQLRDDNIVGVSERPVNDEPRIGQYTYKLNDGTYLIYNTKDNDVARGYNGDWASRFTIKAANAIRPHNQYAVSRDYNHVDSDYYSRVPEGETGRYAQSHYKPSTSRAEDARDLRNNPYFINGKNKEYNPDSGWNRKEADRVMGNLRNGKDRYGNPSKPI